MDFKAVAIVKPVEWIKIAFYGILLIGLFYSSHTMMVSQWEKDDYNYAYLIPIVVLYLLWEKRHKLAKLSSSPSWFGIIPFIVGICFYWLGELGGEYLTLYISSWLILVGICWMHLGWQKLKAIAFALFFILTMFPLPDFLYTKITVKLQLISSKLGVALIQLYGMSAYREGNVIDLGFTQLQVVEACSGLRYMISLVVLGILMVYFFKAAFWKRAVLLISVIPLSIFTNSLRIALTGILYELWGPEVAEGFFHGFSGLVIFILCLPVLLIEMWVLNKVGGPLRPDGMRKLTLFHRASLRTASLKDEGAKGGSNPSPPLTSNLKPQTGRLLRAFLNPPQFIVTVLLLGTTLAFSQGIEFREKIPIKKPLDRFPLEVGEWSGVLQGMEQKFIDVLDLSDYVIIDYKNSRGMSINFYVAYYESQRKGESIHSPASCLPGSGWVFNEAGAKTISIPGYEGGFMQVNRAFMQKGEYRQLSYYWFAQRGRILTNAYQLKIFAFWDALIKQRTDGALVRVITPINEYEELKDAEDRLQSFIREIVPLLNQYIPGRDIG